MPFQWQKPEPGCCRDLDFERKKNPEDDNGRGRCISRLQPKEAHSLFSLLDS